MKSVYYLHKKNWGVTQSNSKSNTCIYGIPILNATFFKVICKSKMHHKWKEKSHLPKNITLHPDESINTCKNLYAQNISGVPF